MEPPQPDHIERVLIGGPETRQGIIMMSTLPIWYGEEDIILWPLRSQVARGQSVAHEGMDAMKPFGQGHQPLF